MKRRKLTLTRETLRQLSNGDLQKQVGARFAENQSIQSGETYCWCTDTCNCVAKAAY